jgi:ABC-type uncharacterized transport system ATPase subunit
LTKTPYTQGFENGRDWEMRKRKSFLDEAIAHAKDQERQRILELVKSQGEPWEVVVIEEIMEIINNEVF